MLEANDDVVGVPDHDHVARGLAPSPAFGPEVENVVQVDVGKQRRSHRTLPRPPVADRHDPVFQKTRLLADGRVEIDPALEATASHLPEELYRTLLRGFDEILMSELLAVKKSLGPVHESALVRALEKVGCL